jgi:hypothetical protein
MRIIRLFIFTLFVTLNISTLSAQVYRFKATSFSVIEKDAKNNWGKWTEPEQSTAIISLDGKKDRLVIGTKEIQVYIILNYGQKVVTQFDETIALDCADLNGKPCTILVVTRKNQDDRKQFYVNYEDVKFVYNVYVVN